MFTPCSVCTDNGSWVKGDKSSSNGLCASWSRRAGPEMCRTAEPDVRRPRQMFETKNEIKLTSVV